MCSIPEGAGTGSLFQEDLTQQILGLGQANRDGWPPNPPAPGRTGYTREDRMKRAWAGEKGIVAFAEPSTVSGREMEMLAVDKYKLH